MAFINYQDPKDGEANSPLIAGITEGLKKISQVLNMEIQTLVDSPMEKVPYYDDNGDEINVLYQSPAGNKCWLPSPPPIIKKNGIALTESTYTIDYVGGSIFFSRNSQQLDSDVFTVDVTIIKPSSAVLNESNEKIEDLVSSTASYKGYYETLDELKVAYPRSNLGDFAIIGGDIDTIAVWDKESNDWKMITSDIDLSGYYTKAEVENIKTNLQNNIDNTNTALTEGLAEKVDTTAFDEAIAKKVDTTAFDEKMTELDTSLSAKADKTLENVSDDDLKKRVQGLDIGGGLKNLKDNLTSDGAIYGVNTVSDPTVLGIPQGKNSFQFGEGTISGNNNSMAIGENSIVNFQNTGVPITRIVNDGVAKKITVGFDFLTDNVKNNLILARDFLNTQGKSFDIYLNAKLITPDDTGAFDFVKVTVSNTDGNNPLNMDMSNLDLFIADYDNFVAKYSVDDLSFFVLVGNDELTFSNKDNAVSTGFSLGDGNLNQGNLTNSSIVSGSMNVNMSSNSIVGGRKNTVSKSDNSVVTGEANISSGDKYSFLSGTKNNVQNSNSSIVTGTNNFVISSGDSIVSGDTNVVMSDRSIVNGQYNKIFGYSNNLAIGVGNYSSGENVYNIGTNNVGVTTRESINSGINIGSGNLSNSACSAGIVESYVVGETSTTIVVNLDYDFADSPIMNFLKVGDNLLFIATEASKSTQSRTIESIDVDNHSFTVPNFSDTTFVPRAFSAERKNIDANGVQNFNLGSENTLLGRNSVSFGSRNINAGDYSYVLGLENNSTKNHSLIFGYNNTCNSYLSVVLGKNNIADTSTSDKGNSITSGSSNLVFDNFRYTIGDNNVSAHRYNSGVVSKVDSDNNTFYTDESIINYSVTDKNILVGSEIYLVSKTEYKEYKILEKNGNAIKVDSAMINSPLYFVIKNVVPTGFYPSLNFGMKNYLNEGGSLTFGMENIISGSKCYIWGEINEIITHRNFIRGELNFSDAVDGNCFGTYSFMNGSDWKCMFGTRNILTNTNSSYKIDSYTAGKNIVTVESDTHSWTPDSFSKLEVNEYVVLTSNSVNNKVTKAKIVSIDTTNYTITLDRPIDRLNYNYIIGLKNRNTSARSFQYAFGMNNYVSGSSSFCIGKGNTVKGSGFVYGESNTVESGVEYSVAMGNNCRNDESYSFAFGNPYVYNGVMYAVETTGINSFAFGKAARTEGQYSFAFGDPYVLQFNNNVLRTLAKGYNSFAFGTGASSDGNYSFSFGYSTQAKGNFSFAFGRLNGNNSTSDVYTVASGSYTIAFGEGAATSADHSYSIGLLTKATGNYSLALGNKSQANSNYSYAIGYQAIASKNYSFAFGNSVTTSGEAAFAAGWSTTASGRASACFGISSTASGDYSFAFGSSATASGNYSCSIGVGSKATGVNTFAFGDKVEASSNYTCSMGYQTKASSLFSFAFGNTATASGTYSFAFGKETYVDTNYSFAFGDGTKCNGYYSFAFGDYYTEYGTSNRTYTNAFGNRCFAFGSGAEAKGQYSFAFGSYSSTYGNFSMSFGSNSRGTGSQSILIGSNLNDNGKNFNTIIGKINKLPTNSASATDNFGDAFIIGNGTLDSSTYPAIENRSNCFRVQYDGKVYSKGAYNTSGADLAETIEWWDKNPDGEDRRGRFVTLDGNYIKFADTPEQVFGCVSSNPSLIGNNESETWHDMYLKDIWGELILQEVTVPDEYETTYEDYTDVDENGNEVTKTSEVKTLVRESYKTMAPIINPDYNPDMEYKPRSERKEYCITGREGQIVMCDDGTCEVGKLCNTSHGGYATKTDKGYMVMERIDSSHIKIYFGWIKTNEELGIIS